MDLYKSFASFIKSNLSDKHEAQKIERLPKLMRKLNLKNPENASLIKSKSKEQGWKTEDW